jgi:dTDP-glucose pyrophosphorylase
MIPLNGRPMIEHIVRRLHDAGVREILIVVGYHGDLIQQHFRQGFEGVSFAVQEVAEGTASAVRLGREFAGADPFILTYGDIICDAANYSGISGTFRHFGDSAALGVKYADDPWQGAAVYCDEAGAVTKIIEKPARGSSTTHWNSAGLYAFAPEIFDEIATVPKSPRGEYEITTAIEQLIEHGRPVRLFEMTGAWRDVGRPEDLAAANDILST